MSCGTLTRGSTAGCDLAPAGTRARLILINHSDIVKIYTNDDGKIIRIVLQTGLSGGIEFDFELDALFGSDTLSTLTAYEFTGFSNDVKKSEETEKTQQHKKRFRHNCSFVVYETDQLQKANLKALAKGRFLAIVESNGETEDSIEVLGRDVGLSILEGEVRNATTGVFVLNLSTPDNGVEWERKLPQTLGVSYQNGLNIIDELLGGSSEEPVVGEGIFDESFDVTYE